MDEAARHNANPPYVRGPVYATSLAPVLRRRLANQGVKARAESSQAGVAEVETNLGDGFILLGQHAFGLVNPQLSQELVGRLPEAVRKQPVIMKRRQVGVLGRVL